MIGIINDWTGLILCHVVDHNKTPKTGSILGLPQFLDKTLLRHFWFEGLAAGILGHVAPLVGNARTNLYVACAARTGSIVMMAFFDHAVDTSGHSAHPLSLIEAFAGAHGRYAALQTKSPVKQSAILRALSTGKHHCRILSAAFAGREVANSMLTNFTKFIPSKHEDTCVLLHYQAFQI